MPANIVNKKYSKRAKRKKATEMEIKCKQDRKKHEMYDRLKDNGIDSCSTQCKPEGKPINSDKMNEKKR
jgi:hypothetical protein